MLTTTTSAKKIPRDFLLKRLHSLAGLWLVVYLILHLFTNSQAALFLGDDGIGFIHSVNSIHELPYLPIIEITILAIPILIHALWGIQIALTAKYNSFGDSGTKPYLPEYPRNRAYTWQRITSWLLVVGILAHVIHMRFIEYPTSARVDGNHSYMIRVTLDDGLYTLSKRLGVQLYDERQIHYLKEESGAQATPSITATEAFLSLFASLPEVFKATKETNKPDLLIEEQHKLQYQTWLKALEKRPLRKGEVIAVADNFATVELLMLRDTFKNPIMLVLYTLLVLTTCFHAFNGLWTALISWGVTISQRSQRVISGLSIFLMIAVSFLGLSAVWLTYWINLKQ